MRIIAEGQEDIIKLWGFRAPQASHYRLMKYHIRVDDENGTLLLNTVTGELVLLNDGEAAVMTSVILPYNPVLDELIAHRFLVPLTFDETKSVDQLRNLSKKLSVSKEIRGYSILPTSACNARCFYCFESNDPHYTMTENTAFKVVDYIISHCGESKKVSLKWFGGEPTLGEARIDQICDLLTKNGISYTSSMISNAYLFSKEMVSKAKEKWKLLSIQITLDGTEEIYNRVKAYVNAKDNPFQRVMNNIGYLLDEGIRVLIRMNLDSHNEKDLYDLVEQLAKRFAGRKNLSVYAAVLFEDCGSKPIQHTKSEYDKLINSSVKLNSWIEEKGCNKASRFQQNASFPALKPYYCMADNPNSLQINPLGQFGKCEHDLYRHLVGDVDSGYICESPDARRWMNPEYHETCKACPLYPYCGIIKACEPGRSCLTNQIADTIAEITTQIQKKWKTGQEMKEAMGDEETRV